MSEREYFEQFSGEACSQFQVHTYPLHVNNIDKALNETLRRAIQHSLWSISVGTHDERGNWKESYKITSTEYFKTG